MLEVQNLTIMIGTRLIIKDLSFTLNKSDKLAIIGEEGNGKSTLLKALLKMADYAKVQGVVDLHNYKVGYLKQSLDAQELELSGQDYLFSSKEDYYNKLNVFYKYLKMLELKDDVLDVKMANLSGGERIKVSILKLLIEDDDILFLDEPTNDLDLNTLYWLESFINKITKPLIYVSHDETLLANTANMILHLEQIKNKSEPRHTLAKVDYDTYVSNRLNALEKQLSLAHFEKKEFLKKEKKLQQVMQKVEYQQRTITRKDPHGARLLKKKMHSLKAQEKRLNNWEIQEEPDIEESINLFFKPVEFPRSKVVLTLDLPVLKVENKESDSVLAKDIFLEIVGPTHLCIIGRNGAGKTTLLKQIYEKLKDRKDLKVGYMPQNYDVILGGYASALEFLRKDASKNSITEARSLLGNLNFTKEEMTTDISYLSGGTKAKLLLAKLVQDEDNVLILDEPTRNVSPLSNPVIRKMLKDFQGTIISVSHDRKYINEVIDNLYLLDKNGLKKIDKEKINY